MVIDINKYKIKKININNYKVIIFGLSHESPLLYLDDISKELKFQNIYICKVVFDMLLCNGNTTERYIEAVFNGEQFVDTSFKYIKVDKKNELRKIALDIINSDKSILENSILTLLQKKMINKGIKI